MPKLLADTRARSQSSSRQGPTKGPSRSCETAPHLCQDGRIRTDDPSTPRDRQRGPLRRASLVGGSVVLVAVPLGVVGRCTSLLYGLALPVVGLASAGIGSLIEDRGRSALAGALVEARTARPATDAGMAIFRHASGRWMSDDNADHSQLLADSAADSLAISPRICGMTTRTRPCHGLDPRQACSHSFSVAQAKLVGGLAEPAGEVVVQVLLIVADPGDVAVGA